jgi:hypothetical protein
MDILQTKVSKFIESRPFSPFHFIRESRTKYKNKETHPVQVTFLVEGPLVELADSPKRIRS